MLTAIVARHIAKTQYKRRAAKLSDGLDVWTANASSYRRPAMADPDIKAMRPGLQKAIEIVESFEDYNFRGHEDEHTLSGMFARGNRNAKRWLSDKLRFELADNDRTRAPSDTISHDEAEQIASRLIAVAFNRSDNLPRFSIPANPDRDDDLRMLAYIRQQRRAANAADR